jgi:CO/xanthine dehydrogenase FAD-binding subunit
MTSKVFMPRSLDELWDILDKNPQARTYAGGTDLLVKLRAAASSGENSQALVCLERIGELAGIKEYDDRICIKACTTHSRLLSEPAIQQHFPVLAKALDTLGSPLIRNMGTIGGNICTASPAGDALPPLYVLGAVLELKSASGSRTCAINEFISGPGKVALKQGEILYSVLLDKHQRWNVQHFEKVSKRKALSIAIASLAAVAEISDDNTIEKIRCAWGSVGPAIAVSRAAEEFLSGKILSLDNLQQAAVLADPAFSPIGDLRASAEYRREVAGNLLQRLLDYKKS